MAHTDNPCFHGVGSTVYVKIDKFQVHRGMVKKVRINTLVNEAGTTHTVDYDVEGYGYWAIDTKVFVSADAAFNAK